MTAALPTNRTEGPLSGGSPVDRSTLSPRSKSAELSTIAPLRSSEAAAFQGALASPDVEALWKRYQGYLDAREPLPSMAYPATGS